ncbi:peptidylprolyl isomerase [Polyangium mundeleinium]|uniref:peptidylprolyl isomerase n=1 Tax=Polyangium mundeleinium TaxID=2995306 RepID=A0ABT5EMQ9_9BACT|nr:peptidylprolyl isomerase [Polyangium mundeleinium]MDC0742001.1 peptidylprolyl isomerase [Polyangium mundeleinium]
MKVQGSRRSRAGRVIGVVAALGACSRGEPTTSSTSDAGSDAGSDAAVVVDEAKQRQEALLVAEQRRTAAEITSSDQQSRDVLVRRAAARALARIGGEDAKPGLLRALVDEDPEVVTWAAYGLGSSCTPSDEATTVTALVARSLSIGGTNDAAPAKGSPPVEGRANTTFDPRVAIARAVGRCGAVQSEPTLVAWLSGTEIQASAAAFALGDLAMVKERLREETLAALLNVAAGSASSPPAPEGLFPIGRLENVPNTVTTRLREVAGARLAEPGPYRIFAVRALGRAGPEAAADLGRVLAGATLFTAAERAEAARALRRLGTAGQTMLASTLPALVPPGGAVALTALGEEIGVLLATLDALEPTNKAKKWLKDLATMEPPPSAPVTVLRRLSWIRCSAATVLAGADVRDPLLTRCDVTAALAAGDGADAGAKAPGQPGSIGARAMVKVLDRAPIEGSRRTVFLTHAKGGDLRAREAAIELLPTHEELAEDAGPLLESALAAPEPGLVSTAAGVIARKPNLAAEPEKRKKKAKKKGEEEQAAEEIPLRAPSPAIVKAIVTALGRADVENDPEHVSSMIEAAGALGLKETLPRLEELCRSSWPELRKRAAKAIGLVSGKPETPSCQAPPGGGPKPPELDARAAGKVTLTLETDVGEASLVLDADVAPVAVTRVVDLARAGYYDGMVVHRVVPGFVTQLGAPFGDGYGGPPGKAPLRCETSPIAFDPLTVGVALAGRDTGSSQIFVTHARQPHLDGQYAWIGRATGPWSSFVDGDLVHKVSVKP